MPKLGYYAADGSARVTVSDSTAQSPTYVVTGSAYTAYATPTDLFCISGSATKIVHVTGVNFYVQSTASSLQSWIWLKRSTANTGGSSTTPTPIPLDSADPAATAVFTLYTAAPTTGALVGNLWIQNTLTGTTVGAPGVLAAHNTINGTPIPSLTTYNKPITLRGIAESFCLNFNGAALPSGFTSQYEITWTET